MKWKIRRSPKNDCNEKTIYKGNGTRLAVRKKIIGDRNLESFDWKQEIETRATSTSKLRQGSNLKQ